MERIALNIPVEISHKGNDWFGIQSIRIYSKENCITHRGFYIRGFQVLIHIPAVIENWLFEERNDLAFRRAYKVSYIKIDDKLLSVYFESGLIATVYIDKYSPRLKNATQAQRENYEICGAGSGLHWPDVDEDLSIKGLVRDSI